MATCGLDAASAAAFQASVGWVGEARDPGSVAASGLRATASADPPGPCDKNTTIKTRSKLPKMGKNVRRRIKMRIKAHAGYRGPRFRDTGQRNIAYGKR